MAAIVILFEVPACAVFVAIVYPLPPKSPLESSKSSILILLTALSLNSSTSISAPVPAPNIPMLPSV